jgi:hypothetical protein
MHVASCLTHAFANGGQLSAAYESDCLDWQRSGFDIYLYYVVLANRTGRSLPFSLRGTLHGFLVVSRSGQTFAPVNVRERADTPPAFLPESGTIAPHASLRGWLTFDGRLDFIPLRISYVDGNQTLTIKFPGKHRVLARA